MSFSLKTLSTIARQSTVFFLKNKNYVTTPLGISPPINSLFTKTSARFFSDKKDDAEVPIKAMDFPKSKQSAINAIADALAHKIPNFVSKIEPKSCKKTIILEKIKTFLEKNNPIQIHQGCLLETIRIVDLFNERKSIFNEPEIIKVISGQIPIEKSLIKDFRVRAFIKAHLQNQNVLTDQQRSMTPTDTHFITKIIGHSELTDVYISADELENHFRNTHQPVYTMVLWGRDEKIETGYQLHCILVFGIDTEDNVHFWDVNDKLPSGTPRIRTMNIEDFNDRRNLPPQYSSGIVKSGWSRSLIFYYNRESKS